MTREKTASNEWKMNDVEIGDYARARAAMAAVLEKSRDAAAKEKSLTKADIAKLGKAMIASIEKRNQELSLSLLFRGGWAQCARRRGAVGPRLGAGSLREGRGHA